MEYPIERWESPSLMPSTIWKPALTKGATGRHSSEHASWYARNASKTFGKRKLPSTPRRSESAHVAHSLCACLALDCSRTGQRAPDRARASFPSSFNSSAHRRPLFGTSLVYVYDGGVIPHRWLISTIPTTAVTHTTTATRRGETSPRHWSPLERFSIWIVPPPTRAMPRVRRPHGALRAGSPCSTPCVIGRYD